MLLEGEPNLPNLMLGKNALAGRRSAFRGGMVRVARNGCSRRQNRRFLLLEAPNGLHGSRPSTALHVRIRDRGRTLGGFVFLLTRPRLGLGILKDARED
jgi:hypothetical protein